MKALRDFKDNFIANITHGPTLAVNALLSTVITGVLTVIAIFGTSPRQISEKQLDRWTDKIVDARVSPTELAKEGYYTKNWGLMRTFYAESYLDACRTHYLKGSFSDATHRRLLAKSISDCVYSASRQDHEKYQRGAIIAIQVTAEILNALASSSSGADPSP